MLILFILITGLVVGIAPGLFKLDKAFSPSNMALGVLGALVGALLGFGDTPLLLEYPILNEITPMIAASILFVATKVSVAKLRAARNQ